MILPLVTINGKKFWKCLSQHIFAKDKKASCKIRKDSEAWVRHVIKNIWARGVGILDKKKVTIIWLMLGLHSWKQIAVKVNLSVLNNKNFLECIHFHAALFTAATLSIPMKTENLNSSNILTFIVNCLFTIFCRFLFLSFKVKVI